MRTPIETEAATLPAEQIETIRRIAAVRDDLALRYLERKALIEMMLVALVAGLPMSIISPPGTAKTALVHALFARITARTFSWLMTRFSTPDELFGPLKLSALQQDRYERATEGRLADAELVFVDEGFKANSATLNAQLSALNERRYEGIACPWRGWFTASNEYPDGIAGGQADGDSLEALWDRYVLRAEVRHLESEANVRELLFTRVELPPADTLTLDEIDSLREFVPQVAIPAKVQDQVIAIRQLLVTEGIAVSDRRLVKSLDVLRATALLRGRMAVQAVDVAALNYCLWQVPQEALKVHEAIIACGPEEAGVLTALIADTRDRMASWRAIRDGSARMGEMHNLVDIFKRSQKSVDEIMSEAGEDDGILELANEASAVLTDAHNMLANYLGDVMSGRQQEAQ